MGKILHLLPCMRLIPVQICPYVDTYQHYLRSGILTFDLCHAYSVFFAFQVLRVSDVSWLRNIIHIHISCYE